MTTLTLTRRLSKALADPRAVLEALEYGPINSFRFWLRQRALPLTGLIGRSQLKRHGVLPDLEAFNAARPASAFEPDWGDLWHLYRDVRFGRHHTCLEYGSGQSTLVIAKALHDSARDGFPGGHLTSLEADEQWSRVNADAIPEGLRSYVDVIHSPMRVLSRLEIRFSHAPVPSPDFVYLDGPAHPAHNMASLDLLDLEPNFPPQFALVVDGRTFNKNQLLRRFKRKYRSRWRSPLSNDTVIKLR